MTLVDAVRRQLWLMGWRVCSLGGEQGRWRKFYPPPQDVSSVALADLVVIGEQCDVVWQRDIVRARVFATSVEE